MRILVVSEGKHERWHARKTPTLGDTEDSHNLNERIGALENLIRALNPKVSEFTHERLSDTRIRRVKGKGSRLTKRAIAWLREAYNGRFDALVLVVDEDGDQARRAEIDKAQATSEFPTKRAMGIAIQMFDAWMLADEVALSNALGCTVQRQPNPEAIKDPKSKCKELRNAGTTGQSLTELYAEVARKADLKLLSNRCPNGFKPFADRVRALNTTKANK